ncbi:S26 family signal peptidase [Leifsonia sp. Root1293]|nr:S26 family signal peptidase [Leifsonia sp. Root1293]KRA09446.1 S26 family signal peptidase [Leifsonia sp. Root60]
MTEPTSRQTTTADDAPDARRERGLLHYLGLGLSIGLLGLVVALAALLIIVPKVGGATPLTVLTQSMEPSLPPGTLVVVGPVEPSEIRVGDVVTYQIRSGEPDVITHRVIGMTSASDGSTSFTLKGDNNAVEDPPVVAEQIKGRLWYSVPFVGYVSSVVNGDTRSWIVPGLAIALFGYAAFMVVSGVLVSMRRRRETDADTGVDTGADAASD